ncbi:hypothetical protein [Spirulina subsalsa]|uniref:hypothetical protein n=1 Tax=Spirulina subsalsa TaxID=54311 RepID=UPI0002D4192D|nr:hypothetical protein [Spirulina subsalsa]
MDSQQLETQLETLGQDIVALAQSLEGDSMALLSLLRHLEQVHRQIREDLFLTSLPDTRQALDNILRDIEEVGGWPYIERLKLQAFLGSVAWSGSRDSEGDLPETKE